MSERTWTVRLPHHPVEFRKVLSVIKRLDITKHFDAGTKLWTLTAAEGAIANRVESMLGYCEQHGAEITAQ